MLPSYLFNFDSLLNPHNVLIILIILFVCDRLKDVSSIFVRHLKHKSCNNIFVEKDSNIFRNTKDKLKFPQLSTQIQRIHQSHAVFVWKAKFLNFCQGIVTVGV